MKTLKKALKWTAIIVVLLIVGLLSAVYIRQSKSYDAPYPDLHASTDSSIIARGNYLVNGPAHCTHCHNPVENWDDIAAGKQVPLEGDFVFNLPIGTLHTPNLTPDETGIGNLTDPEIARALRYGVGHDGRALLDMMPFHNTSDEDLIAILSYLRAQPKVKKEVPKSEYNFLGKVIYAFLMEPVGPETGKEVPVSVKADTTAAYGEYLANYVANCRGCHTNRDLKTGAYVGEYYAGGFAMPSSTQPGITCVTPNLTPDKATGKIANWTQADFIKRIRQGRIIPGSEMPWEPFQKFSDDDLKAIYAYLQTVKPVQNEIKQTVITAAVQ